MAFFGGDGVFCAMPGCRMRVQNRNSNWCHKCGPLSKRDEHERREVVEELKGKSLSDLAAHCDKLLLTTEMPIFGIMRLVNDMHKAEYIHPNSKAYKKSKES